MIWFNLRLFALMTSWLLITKRNARAVQKIAWLVSRVTRLVSRIALWHTRRMAKLTDKEWAEVSKWIDIPANPRGGQWLDHRQVVDALIWREDELRKGRKVTWRMIPSEFGPWQTIWRRYRLWEKDGTLATIFYLLAQSRRAVQKYAWLLRMEAQRKSEERMIKARSTELFSQDLADSTELFSPDLAEKAPQFKIVIPHEL